MAGGALTNVINVLGLTYLDILENFSKWRLGCFGPKSVRALGASRGVVKLETTLRAEKKIASFTDTVS